MPENRPGRIYQPVTATKEIVHGTPASEDGLCGIAVKQAANSWDTAFADLKKIEIDEEFALIAKGMVLVDTFTGGTKGTLAYITTATGGITNASGGGKIPFGTVIELPADGRGVPTGKVRIDLDKKA